MIDRFNFKVNVAGKGKDSGGPGREIWNFEDLRRRVQAMQWDERVKEVFFKRISKYPEASLDYVWKHLNMFLNQAMKEVYGSTSAPVKQIVKQVESSSHSKDELPEEMMRPDFNLEE